MFSVQSLIAIIICTDGVFSKCIFSNFDFVHQPIFSRIVNQKEVIFRAESSSIVIGEGSEIKAYCKLNFTAPIRFRPNKYYDKVLIRCHENSVLYTTYDVPKLGNIDQYAPLSCIQTVSLYRAQSSYCDKQMISIVLETEDLPEFLGDLCYDPEMMEIVFVHYGTASAKWSTHPDFYVFPDEKLALDVFDSILRRTSAINKSLNYYWPISDRLHQYRFEELAPSKSLLENIGVDPQLIPLNFIPWWTNLKDGNWKNVETVTNQYTETLDFDIYTGITHLNADMYTNEDFSKYLHYSIKYHKLQIPFYVWKYIKPKHPYDAHDEVVIIAINFPYLKRHEIKSLEFCTDVCDEIGWLHGALISRKFVSLGYVFCCKPNDARERIKAISKIQYAYRNMYQEEP